MKDFLTTLARNLKPLSENEVREILRDHEEMIRDAIQSGKSESEAVKAFGDPKQLARTLIAESMVSKISAPAAASARGNISTWGRALFAVVALAPFNLIFVLGPFLGALGCLIGGWAVSVASLAGGLALFIGVLFEAFSTQATLLAGLSSFLFSAGIVCFGAAAAMAMMWITVLFGKLTVHYLTWNIRFVAPDSAIEGVFKK